jgi:hypothetical protein
VSATHTGVRDEAALALGGGLQPVQHGVHEVGQATDLIVGRRDGDATVEGAFGDVGHLGADGVDGAQSPSDHRPGGDCDEDEQYGATDGEPVLKGRDRLLDRLQRRGDVDGRRAARRGDTHRDDTERAVVAGYPVDRTGR